MAEKLVMLALSPTMEEGVISRWLKNEGDKIESGDLLAEVETDKTTMDYESSTSGVLLKQVVAEGGSAAIGDLIAIVGEEGEDISALLKEGAAAPAAEIEIKADSEFKKEPASVAQAAKSAEQSAETAKSESVEKDSAQPKDVDEGGMVRASPLARKLAENSELSIEGITGTGPEGRIIKADVEKAIAASEQPAAKAVKPTPAAVSASVPAGVQPQAAPGDVSIPVSGKRRVIAQRLSESKFSAPHYYLKVRVEVDGMLASRKRLNEKAATKISINSFLIKFAAEALKRHPVVNSSWATDSIIQHGSIDIGLAVAQEDGLITPIIRNCGNKGLVQIEKDLQDLIEKARSNSLKPNEYTGATFTISSLGSYGIEEFTAVINPPGSAILAVGEFRKDTVVLPDDSIEIRTLMNLTLSCDHRVIDGAVGAEFLTDLRQMIEDPVRVLY
ncbi:MAG: pyruvate dehydrogenase complex dihydrolipoamide acetyltransferase [Saccharofermentanales bacterium]